MSSKKYVALLTGTIDSGLYKNIGNKIQNISVRLEQYEKSITSYIEQSVFDVIVFAENSGYNFDAERFERIAKDNGKQFEFVSCPSYVNGTIEHGKSYGEARVIEDGIRLSRLLQKCETVYKLTGRIYLRNSFEICRTMSKHRNEFLVYNSKQWCFTNIFKFNVSDYKKYWNGVYMYCDEKTGNDIERVFYSIVSEAKSKGASIGSFDNWPYFDGVQGATLEPYSGKRLERFVRNILAKNGAFAIR